MPQTIRPNVDTTRTGATSHSNTLAIRGQTTMFGCMDDPGAVAADYAECPAGSRGGDVMVVELASPATTPTNDYNHIIGCSISKDSSGGAAVGMVCELRQGYNSETAVADSTADLDEDLDTTETVVTVTDGSVFAAGDVIQIESEEMIITSIATNDLTVTRGAGGTSATTHPAPVTGQAATNVYDVNQGSLIASFTCRDASAVVGSSYYRYRLTNEEAALITDYTDLQLRFVSFNGRGGAPRNCRLHWAAMECPSATDAAADRGHTPEEFRRARHGLALSQESDRQAAASANRPI